MDQDFANQEKIHQYLNGELTDAERKEFQQAFSTDKALKKEVEFSQSLMLLLKNKEAIDVKHQLKNIISTTPIEPDFEALKEFEEPNLAGKNSGSFNKWLLGLIAGVSIFLIGLFFINGNPFATVSTNDALIANHIVPFENVLNTNTNNDDLLKKGVSAYDNGDYTAAANHFSAYQANAFDGNVQFYLGLSKLLNQETKAAVSALEKAVDATAPPVQETAQWYLALAYIKNDQLPAAKMTLKILQNTSTYQAKASDLLIQLEGKMEQ